MGEDLLKRAKEEFITASFFQINIVKNVSKKSLPILGKIMCSQTSGMLRLPLVIWTFLSEIAIHWVCVPSTW